MGLINTASKGICFCALKWCLYTQDFRRLAPVRGPDYSDGLAWQVGAGTTHQFSFSSNYSRNNTIHPFHQNYNTGISWPTDHLPVFPDAGARKLLWTLGSTLVHQFLKKKILIKLRDVRTVLLWKKVPLG